MTYIAVFFGRRAGAIGAYYGIETIVQAKDKDRARLALYERFEHIHALELTEERGKPSTLAGPSPGSPCWVDRP